LKFFKLGLKTIVAICAEYLGFQINTYLCGITRDQNQISAFVSWVNLSTMLYCFGLGFGNVARTNLSNYIGEKKYTQVKNAQIFYTFLVSIIGLILTVVLASQVSGISGLYSSDPGVDNWITAIMKVYCFGIAFDLLSGLQNTTLRVANRATFVAFNVLTCLGFILSVMSWVFAYVIGLEVVGLLISYVIAIICSNIWFAIIIHNKVDWKKVKVEAE